MRVTLRQEEPCLYFNIHKLKRSCLVLCQMSRDIIRKVTVGYVAGSSGPGLRNPERDLTYRVVPRAVQDYDDSYVTTVSEDIDETQKVFTVS